MKTKYFLSATRCVSLLSVIIACVFPCTATLAQSQTDERALEEIIVTANKRSERLQDVPMSISVLSGETLDEVGSNSLTDFAGYIPGLTASSGGAPGAVQMTIRGLGAAPGLGALVSTYVDEFPVGTSSSQVRGSIYSLDLLPYDVERIELLRGPQGTLYGAGSMGGLLKYVLVEPDFSEFEVRLGWRSDYIEESTGLSGGPRVKVNLPLSETLALSFSGFQQRSEGYIDNVGLSIDDDHTVVQEGGRIMARWAPNDKLTLNGSAMLQNIEGPGSATVKIGSLDGSPLYADFATSTYVREDYDTKSAIYGFVAEYDFSASRLTSATSWQRVRTNDYSDSTDGSGFLVGVASNGSIPTGIVAFDLVLDADKFTQELRLSSHGTELFEWQFGLFYTTEDSVNGQTSTPFDLTGNLIPSIDPLYSNDFVWEYEELAGFGNVTANLGEAVQLTLGVRYAENEQYIEHGTWGSLFGSLRPRPPSEQVQIPFDESPLTWMLSPQWTISDDQMIYLQVATGYRPGGYNYAIVAPWTVDSDSVTSYELGYKGQLLDDRMSIFAAVYHIDWDDVHVVVVDDQGFAAVANATTAQSRGGELEVIVEPTDSISVAATVSIIDSNLTADAPGIGGVNGDTLPFSPSVSGSIRIDYNRPIGESASLNAGAGYRYSGEVWSTVESAANATLRAPESQVDLYARVNWSKVAVGLYVTNALNEEAHLSYLGPSTLLPYGLVPLQPRTIGLSVDFVF